MGSTGFDIAGARLHTFLMNTQLSSWSTVAVNLPEHANNPVHTDAGAIAAGFDAALVAGTTIHAYLTHPPAAAWGAAWLDHGWSELRLIAPVKDQERVVVSPAEGSVIEARVGGQLRATLAVALSAPIPDPVEQAILEEHDPLRIDLAERLGDYGVRAGDDLDLYSREGRAHPAVWSCIGNAVTMAFHVDGPWVHVRSTISHLAPVAANAVVDLRSALIDRFDSRAGGRVVIDIEASVQGRPVARIIHESIVRLR